MRKSILNKAFVLISVLICMTSLSSCEEENASAERWFAGEWVVYGTYLQYRVPFYDGDTFYFERNGSVEFVSPTTREDYWGDWTITTIDHDYDYLNIYFSANSWPTMRCRILDVYDDGYYPVQISLDVKDEDYGTYRMTLYRRNYYNYAKKERALKAEAGKENLPKADSNKE